ncbi:conserved hypothetical protein [Burkholderia mallei GB8 horse 4]|nr:conserved hypothetical protein [Burkholderia mallei GB8 horse 4]
MQLQRLLRSGQQLPEHGAQAPSRDSDHARGAVSGAGRAGRRAGARRVVSRAFPLAYRAAGRRFDSRPDDRALAVGDGARRDARAVRRACGGRHGERAARAAAAGDGARSRRADAEQPEGRLSADGALAAAARRAGAARDPAAGATRRSARPRLRVRAPRYLRPALEDLETYLGERPDAADATIVEAQVSELRQRMQRDDDD